MDNGAYRLFAYMGATGLLVGLSAGLVHQLSKLSFGGVAPADVLALATLSLLVVATLSAPTWFTRRKPSELKCAGSIVVLLGAAFFRLVVAFTTQPALSDDIWRYLHDGYTLAAGGNPYAQSPEWALIEMDAADIPLRDIRRQVGMRVNHEHLVTIYQPTSQWVFAVGAVLAGRDATPRDAATVMRLVMVMFDLAVVALLIWLLVQAGRSPWWAALYAWHPLPMIEVAQNGHQDVIGIAMLLLAIALWHARKPASDASGRELSKKTGEHAAPPLDASEAAYGPGNARLIFALFSGFAFVAAAAVKPVVLPAALPVFWLSRWEPKRLAAASAGGLVAAAALYLPFIFMPGSITGMLETGQTFVDKWAFNSLIHRPLTEALGSPATSLLVLACLLATITLMVHRNFDLARILGWYFILSLLLSSTVHPWYLLWALAFVPLAMNVTTWVWSVTILLSYIAVANPEGYRVPTPWMIAEYAPVVVALCVQAWWDGRRRPVAPDRAGTAAACESA